MKRLVSLFTLAVLMYGSTGVWAQEGDKPVLTQMTFYNVSGQKILCSSGGYVSVELLFDKAMTGNLKPTIKYGRNGNYNLTLPLDGDWENNTLYQGAFTVSPNVPSEPDGEYFFLVFGAQDTFKVAMDSTYSDSLNASLAIYRTSNIVSEKDSIDFGVVTFGKSKLDSVRLTNLGCGNITITSATLTNATHFALLNNITGALKKDGSVVAYLRYQPASRQAHQTRLRVIYTVNALGDQQDTVEVVLRGRAKGPRIVFAPTALNFGPVGVNNSLTRQVLVINSPAAETASSDTLRIDKIATTWNNIFQVNPLDLPRVIAPADTDTVRVTFKPIEAIAYNANLLFTSNDSGPQVVNSVPLSGSGTVYQPPPPIDTLNIDWTRFGGYPGYASGDTLYVCIPSQIANIAFVRWKIVTSNIAPQNATDYTGFAIPDTVGGGFCFKIPLANIVTAGRNYFWIWLERANGASGFGSAYYSPLYYYSGAPAFGNWNVSNGYWPGGFANFTNANLIPICWTVQDGRNVAEVRWKLVRNPIAPTSAADTTNGGSFTLALNDTLQSLACANLLLNKLYQTQGYQGNWYAYFWVIDKAGNSGHANAVTFRFKLDTTAPVAPGAPTARTIPVLTWIQPNQTLGLTLTLPNGAKDAARVRWKFKNPPTSTSAPDGEALLSRSGDNASFNVLFNNPALCGDDSLYYWVADSAGNANPLNYSLTRYRFDMCPPPPITTLNVDWTRYGGYTGYVSNDFLEICLPINIGSVASVRWKIFTSFVAPQSATDTTGSAIPDTVSGQLCFRIPLRNFIATGRNYFWIWLEGTNGISGFSSAYYMPLYYYSGAPALVNWNVSGGYWPGGFPYYTNANYIPICWTVQDGRNVAEVRWKLVRGLNPPANAADTTNGGRFRLAPNDTTQTLACANLRLNKLFQLSGFQGNWYAYFWVVDKAGISGHANAVPFRFKLDTTAAVAPGAPSSRTIPVLTWFGANQNWGLTLALPLNARDAARVRWKFNTAPTSTSTPDGEALLTRSGSNASFNVFFNSSVPCGDDTLYYWVADSAGNADPTNYSQTRYRFDMCPPTLTRVKSLSNNVAPIGQAFTDRLLVQDAHSGVDTVWVNYRLGGASTEAPPLPAFRVGNTDTFQFTIPIAGVTRRGIEFRATARDRVAPAYNGPNVSNGPTNGPTCYDDEGGGDASMSSPTDDTYWYPIRTRTLGDGDYRVDANGNPVPLVAGDTTTSYQLFSIPYVLDNGNAVNTLRDDLGAYDATQWRLFDYLPQNPVTTRWAEGTSVRPFAPGRSFFIITRKPNIVLDSGPGVTRRTVCPDTLTVYEGWNLIATPFNFPVHKRSLSLVNANQDTVSLWSFENQWTFTDVMDAWRGYAIYVVRNPNTSPGTPIRLIVQPVAVPGRIGKTSAEPFTLQAQEWAVKIAAQANGAQDNLNWAGVRANAQIGYDALELAEPPVIGGYVSVSFARPEWQQPAEHFATDFRPASDEEHAWEFEVATNQTHANVRVSFNFLGDLPASANVFVIDEALGIAQNLRTNAEYTFRTGAAPVQKKLKLVVGSEQFAAKQAGEIALVPEKFEVLQNFPNPFNPETSIRYNLPEAVNVSVVIYDQLGRRVRTLVDNALQQAGYQNVLWDGRDAAGRPVATGIYLYKVTAGKQALVRKMVLAK